MTIRVVPDAAPSGEVYGAFVLMNDIHGLKQAQEALRASEAELRLIMDNVPARVSYIDRDYRILFLNRHNEDWLGEAARSSWPPDCGGQWRGTLRAALPLLDRVLKGETVSAEKLLAQPEGEQRWEAVHYAPNRDAEGNVIGIYAVHTDIHDQKRNEEELRRANWMLSSHINNTPLSVLEWDRDFRLVRWSPQAENIFGWSSDEILGMPMDDNPLVHEDDREGFAGLVGRLMSGEEPRATGLTRNTRKGGEHDLVRVVPLRPRSTTRQHRLDPVVRAGRVVADQAEERLQYLATRDALTGLPNRLLLHERLAQAIAQAKRSGRRVGVLFIDLDRFKNVNDTLGHRIGDELLKRVSAAYRARCARPICWPGWAATSSWSSSRTSTILRCSARSRRSCWTPSRIRSDRGARHLRDVVDRHQRLSGRFGRPRGTAEARGRRDVSLEGARAQHFQYLDADLAQQRLRQHTLESALRNALKDGLLRLHYQPIVRVADNAIVGAEALLRWNDAEHGNVSPKVFIRAGRGIGPDPRARRVGAADRGRAMRGVAPRGAELTVSVNLSGRQFYRDDIAQRISDIVRRPAAIRRGSSSK